jgi:tetratricopeptide (TPR) repeat protein
MLSLQILNSNEKMKSIKIIAAVLLLSSQVMGQSALDEGKKELDKENFAKAKNILRKALNDGSTDRVQTSYYLGNAYLRLDDADSAKICYRVPGFENKTVYGQLANGRLWLLNGDKTKAKTAFENAAVSSKMKNSEVLYQIGDAWFRPTITDLSEAIRNFEDAYKLDSKNTTNMLELGDAYLENNEGGKAMSKYESAAEVNSKLTLAFIKIGRLNVRARTYDDAYIALKKAIALEPDYAVPHYDLFEAYFLGKKYDLAKAEIKRYIELNKDDAEAKTKFLSFLFGAKEYEQAASEGAKMIDQDPTNFVILRALFYSNYELKHYREAGDFATRFWVSAPTSKVKPLDYVYSAKIASKNNDTATALKYFNVALTADSANGDLLSDYALLMYNTKRYSDAVANYTKRIAKFPNATFYDYYWLGRANYNIGLGFKAKKDDKAAKDSAAAYFTAADSAFAVLTTKYATVPDGWQWRAKANNNLDPDMKTAGAKPFYEQFIKVVEAGTDAARYKNFMVEAYQYLGAHYLNAKDTGTARGFLNKAAELDPANELTKELLKGL